MRLESSQTAVLKVSIQNTGPQPWAGAYVEVEHPSLSGMSIPVSLRPGESTEVEVRVTNTSYSALDVPELLFRFRSLTGEVYYEEHVAL